MLTDLRDLLTPPTLKLPIGGTVYTVPECSAATWLRFQEVNNRAADKIAEDDDTKATLDDVGDGMSETEMIQLALGDAYQQMLSGGVRPSELRHAGITAYYWQLGNEDVAVAMWEAVGKAPAAQTPPPPDPSTSTTTPEATSSTASPTTTTSRPRKPREKAS